MKKYIVILNWYKELHKFHTVARSKMRALNNGIHQLAELLDRPTHTVRSYIMAERESRFGVEEVNQDERT